MSRSSAIGERIKRGKGTERSALTAVRWKPEELAELRVKAEVVRLPLSVFIRRAALGHSLVSRAGVETLRHAGMIVVHLQEIQALLEAQGLTEPENLAPAIDEGRQVVHELLELCKSLDRR
ncbi:MAG: hypothetical protein SF066_00105 [Thermoanaerobaculia bacterium]|nr:hypothetical protein [Thermoanaerobaculia bacterium]